MKTLGFSLVGLLLVAGAAGPSEKAPAGDLGRLQGTWTTKTGPERDIKVSLEITGHSARVKIEGSDGLSVQARGDLRIDDQSEPHTMDWVNFESQDHQEIPDLLAIYELSGGKFKLCTGGFHNDRPSEFKSGDGVLADVFVFERIAPDVAGADKDSKTKR
jgi:uncharacterized protein (TIGR03067 family)